MKNAHRFLIFSLFLSLYSMAAAPQCQQVFNEPVELVFNIALGNQDTAEFMLASYQNLVSKGQLDQSAAIIKDISKI